MKSLGVLYGITLAVTGILSFFWSKILQNPFLTITCIGIIMWIPGLLALFLARVENISLPVFVRPNRSFFLGPLWLIGVGIIAFWVSYPWVNFRLFFLPEMEILQKIALISIFLIGVYFFALTTNMIFSLGEELFWRGYLWEKWKGLGPLKAVWLIGIAWGVWHFPMLLFLPGKSFGIPFAGSVYPGAPIIGCGLILLFTIFLNFLFMYFRLLGKAIMVPAAMHGVIHLGVIFSWVFYEGTTSRILGVSGLSGFFMLGLLCLGMKLFSERTWKKVV